MNRIKFKSFNEVKDFYRVKTSQTFSNTLRRKSLDVDTIKHDDINTLKSKLDEINLLLDDKDFIKSKTFEFSSWEDFEIIDEQISPTTLNYSITSYLNAHKQFIIERINQLEQASAVETIKDLVEELPENEIKSNIKTEIEELQTKNAELQNNRALERERVQEEIEFDKHKAEMFEKRSNVFLKFIDRESMASIVGSLLLLLMGICLLVMMFLQIEPIKIVESAFLLILGYFFGHSKSNK
ncbi:hypothetical protein JOE44_001937 [Chryseobacterium sp. PvR013]|uniref:hypothetical protein n=1 Tax=Chryseobacterium sp. PvR013 TaxID=2806595 RepID=UPI001AE82451|nr:hypothetical protein [Chryseobacterium sp. PvR013]MBP1165053.1 hypothetical protein [Chryseobacterium sp. PvR013]